MNNRSLNVFILNDDASTAGQLRKYLKHRFGNMVKISMFFNSRSCLTMLDSHVDLVVVDDNLHEAGASARPGIDVLKQIKDQQPGTEVVILSTHEDIGTRVDALRNGARDFILNKRGAFHRIRVILDQSINQPIRYVVAVYGV
jgi:DNA-binding NarL/FixJ family response regulator